MRTYAAQPVTTLPMPMYCSARSYYIESDTCSFFFFSSRRRHTRFDCDWSSDVCSSDLVVEHADLARTDGRRDLILQVGRYPHFVGQVVDILDAGHLHRLQRRNVPRLDQGLVGGDDPHVAEVEVVELAAGEVAGCVVPQGAHGQLLWL